MICVSKIVIGFHIITLSVLLKRYLKNLKELLVGVWISVDKSIMEGVQD